VPPARGSRRSPTPDGGIPFVLPGFEDYPHSPWWLPESGSFLTFGFAAVLHEGRVKDDPWLDRSTAWCWRAIDSAEQPNGYWLKYACAFLDAVPDEDRARDAIASLATRIDPAALAPEGGAEGEGLRPLDLSPSPGSRSRELFGEAQVQAHLDAVEEDQQDDGGWMFDWLAWSPAQTNRLARQRHDPRTDVAARQRTALRKSRHAASA